MERQKAGVLTISSMIGVIFYGQPLGCFSYKNGMLLVVQHGVHMMPDFSISSQFIRFHTQLRIHLFLLGADERDEPTSLHMQPCVPHTIIQSRNQRRIKQGSNTDQYPAHSVSCDFVISNTGFEETTSKRGVSKDIDKATKTLVSSL